MPTDTAFLKQRRQTWYFQVAVPRDLQGPLAQLRGIEKPVKVLVQSLATRDKGVAQRLRWDRHREALELFDRLRGKKSLTLAEMEEAAERTMRDFLTEMEELAKSGQAGRGPEVVDEYGTEEMTEEGGLELQLSQFAEALEENDYETVKPFVGAVIERTGAEIIEGSREHVELCRSQLRALIEATKGRLAYLRGASYEPNRPFTTPVVDPIALTVRRPLVVRRKVTAARGEKFVDASARYVAEMMRDKAAAWTNQTKNQNEVTYRLFSDYLNGAPTAAVTREDAVKFLDLIATLDPDYGRSPTSKGKSLSALLEQYGSKGEGLSNRTLNRHTTALTSFFKWAQRAGIYSGDNPFSGLLRKVGRNKEWLPLNAGELEKLVHSPLLFNTPRAQRVKPSKHSATTALAWVPLIALFSGMRSEEICQLRVGDVRNEDGVWFFNVTEEDGGQVKTEAGTRRVPVHSALIKAGLLDYLKHTKKNPSEQLFPGLRRGGPDRKFNHYMTKRIGEHFKQVGIKRERVVLHSLRKNVVNAFERARVHQSEAALIIGHERGFTFSKYNPLGLELPALRKIVEKIRYQGLDLSHLTV